MVNNVNAEARKYWSGKASGLTPYVAGEQPAQPMIKLNTNENAYPPSPSVAQAIAGAAAELRLYPTTDAKKLREAIAEVEGVSADNIFCSNGSDEALALCFMAFFDPGRPVKTMDVTYSFYPVWAKLFDLTLDIVPLREDFSADAAGLCGGAGAVIANPNAPTGMAMALPCIEEILQSTKGVVIVDEAYVAFGAQSALPLIDKYENLAVVRTFSKSHSLAGLRAGYVAAQKNLITALNAVKDSFNSYTVDMLAQAGAAAAMRDTAYYAKTTADIINERERTTLALAKMGYSVLPSAANFIFVKCADAADTFASLRERGILVRYFPGGRTNDYLRVTIGTAEQMDAFLAAMEKIKQ